MDQTYTAENGTTVLIACNIIPNYGNPAWMGPPMDDHGFLQVYNMEADSSFFTFLRNYNRLSWANNNKDLILSDVVKNDEGKYQCFGAGAGSWTIQLNLRGRHLIVL